MNEENNLEEYRKFIFELTGDCALSDKVIEELKSTEIVSKLVYYRIRFGLTQKRLAVFCGVNVKWIVTIEESKDSDLTTDDIYKYMDGLIKFVKQQ